MRDGLDERLQAYCTRAFPELDGARVEQLLRMTGGMDHAMYAFDLDSGPAGDRRREALVLRMYQGDRADAACAYEFHGMRRLHEAAYPVPRVLCHERDASIVGTPFVIMERIEGQLLGPLLFRAPETEQRRLLTQFTDLLVRLHTLDWRPFAEAGSAYEPGRPYLFVDRGLRGGYDALERFPTWNLLPFLKWLEERRDQAPCLRPALVHGDFHPWNVLLRDDGSPVVIDWPGLEVWDARLDVAWTMTVLTAFGGARWRDRVLQEYEQRSGLTVEPIEFFEVSACISFLFILIVSLARGRATMHPNVTAMIKTGAFTRACEVLRKRTGIRWVEVERALASDS